MLFGEGINKKDEFCKWELLCLLRNFATEPVFLIEEIIIPDLYEIIFTTDSQFLH